MAAMYSGYGGEAQRGQEREVHPERLVRHFAAAADLLGQQLWRFLGQAGDQPEAAGVGHGRGELGEADVVHAALDDGVADAEKFSDACLHCVLSSPGFHVGAQVHLESPGITRLRVQVPVVLRDVLGVQDAVLLLQCVAFGEVACG